MATQTRWPHLIGEDGDKAVEILKKEGKITIILYLSDAVCHFLFRHAAAIARARNVRSEQV